MDNKLEKLIKVINSIILTIFAIVVPIFCGFAYGINMPNLAKFFLTIITFGEAVIVWICIWAAIGE